MILCLKCMQSGTWIISNAMIFATAGSTEKSLSPGTANIERAWEYCKYAIMWRITDDFWDEWHLLKAL